MSSERVFSERRSAEKLCYFENVNVRSKGTVSAEKYSLQPRQSNRQTSHRRLHQKYHPSSAASGGNRGFSHPPWGCGPREPQSTTWVGQNNDVFTIFIDGLSSSVSVKELRKLGERFGPVVDSFISWKKRKNTKWAFGFIRYNHGNCAEHAINELHGYAFFGVKLRVSWAKYERDGRPFHRRNNNGDDRPQKTNSVFLSPALRDNRRYSEVVKGTGNPGSTKVFENMMRKSVSTNKKKSMVPILLNVRENPAMVKNLKLVVVIVIEKRSDIKKIEAFVSENDIGAECLSSLSPNKLVLFLEDNINMERLLENNSPLRKLVVDVRKWSVDEQYGERLVWIECVGVHPNCFSFENLENIGNIWGTTVKIDDVYNGVHCLTAGKILIRTTRMEKIEEWVRLKWEDGVCDVWVKEMKRDAWGCDSDEEDKEVSMEEQILCGPINGVTQPQQSNLLEKEVNVLVEEDGSCLKGHNVEVCEEEKEDRGDCTAVVHERCDFGKAVGVCEKDDMGCDLGRDLDDEDTECMGLEQLFSNGMLNESSKEVGNVVGVHCVGNMVGNGDGKGGKSKLVSIDDATLIISQQDYYLEQTQWLDPMLTVELNIPSQLEGNWEVSAQAKRPRGSLDLKPLSCASQKRPRGRPKKAAQSLPEPLVVPSTPSSSTIEAMETWNTAKLLGVKASNEGAVFSALRKSKRLIFLEDKNPSG